MLKTIKRPFAFIGFSLVFSAIFLLLVEINTFIVIVTTFCLIVSALCCFKTYNAVYCVIFCCCFITMLLLISFFYKYTYNPSCLLDGQTVNLSATATEYSTQYDYYSCVTLKNCTINDVETNLCVDLYYYDNTQIKPMDNVICTVTFYTNTLKSKFTAHTLSNKVWLTAFADEQLSVNEFYGHHISKTIVELRESLKSVLFTYLPFDSAATANALLLGDTSFLSDAIKQNFRFCGISHIFAVSGMHLSLWSGIIFVFLKKRAQIKFLPNLAASAFVVFYIMLTGCSPSVIRSGIMLLCVYLARLIKRHADPLNSLGFSAFIILLQNPLMAGNISFLLSFFSTAGMIGIYPHIEDSLFSGVKQIGLLRQRIIKIIKDILMSLVVLFTTTPLSGFFFGCISLLSPLANLLCSFSAQITMVSAFIGLLLSPFPEVARVIFEISNVSASYILLLSEKLSEATFALVSVEDSYITVWYVLTFILLIFVYLKFEKKLSRCVIALLCSCVVILSVGTGNTFYSKNDVSVYIPSAGSLSPVCISTNLGETTLLLGTGNNYKALRNINSFMYKNAAKNLDCLLIVNSDSTNDNTILTSVLSDFSPQTVFAPTSSEIENSDVIFTDSLRETVFDGLLISFEYKNCVSTVYFEIYGTSFLYLTTPSADYSEISEKYGRVDYLICCEEIYNSINTGNYQNIIILSDDTDEKTSLPQNAVSNANNDIKITLKGD